MKERKRQEGITLVALVITILFSYDEKLKCSNSFRFPPTNNLVNYKIFTYLENEFVKKYNFIFFDFIIIIKI